MNLACNISDFEIENTFFLDIKKNIIIDGTFTKIIYSTSNVSFNGIYLIFPIITESKIIQKHMTGDINIITKTSSPFIVNRTFNDWKRGDSLIHNCGKYHISSFSILNQHNINIIKELNRIEHTIIEYSKDYFNINKINIYSLRNQLKQGNIKIYNSHSEHVCPNENEFEYSNNIIIKISGIWENDTNIGITYKFLNN